MYVCKNYQCFGFGAVTELEESLFIVVLHHSKGSTVQNLRMFIPKCITYYVSVMDNNLSLWFSNIFFFSGVIDVTSL